MKSPNQDVTGTEVHRGFKDRCSRPAGWTRTGADLWRQAREAVSEIQLHLRGGLGLYGTIAVLTDIRLRRPREIQEIVGNVPRAIGTPGAPGVLIMTANGAEAARTIRLYPSPCSLARILNTRTSSR